MAHLSRPLGSVLICEEMRLLHFFRIPKSTQYTEKSRERRAREGEEGRIGEREE